jgi:REP element-mobilizing transposase RayT
MSSAIDQKDDVAQPSPAASPVHDNVPEPSPAASLARPAKTAYRRDLPHVQRPGQTLSITFVTAKRWQLPESVRQLVLDCCCYANGSRFELHAAVVMPDHVHLLLSPGSDEAGNSFGLSQILNSIKGASAHAVNKALDRRGHVWQPESFDHVLRSSESIRGTAEYVCSNPVRAGLVGDEDEYACLWRAWVEGTVSGASA